MENQSNPFIEKEKIKLDIYLDPEIISALGNELDHFQFSPVNKCSQSICLKDNKLVIKSHGHSTVLPYFKKNILSFLNSSALPKTEVEAIDFTQPLKSFHNVEKKLFAQETNQTNLRESWDEIIKSINSISSGSHSLSSLVENILNVPFLQTFQSSLLVLHIKGQTQASLLGTIWRDSDVSELLNVKVFNSLFNSVKKSKIKSFTTENFPEVNLPFNGSFLAKEFTSKKYSLVSIVSRHDFLSYSKNEIELFETCIDLLQPYFDRLVDQEFSNTKVSELRLCLKDFPLPVKLTDQRSGANFNNNLFHSELQQQDVIYSKNIGNNFKIDFFDSHELRHYAFDLFHFQRISLLGELLNTLRHELSNPLFGLKLGSQIFSTLEVSDDSLEMMTEIEKNINRCQIIMENFSSLYQDQSEARPTSIQKIIDEALVLAKSEVRDIKKSLKYLDESQDLLINVPLIFVVQIIFNLLINASQSIKSTQTGQKGEISLLVSAMDGFLSIEISDNGPGIHQDQASQLFKPFFTTKPQGTGLGLVLSRNLAVKMGGNLEFCPSATGGATFKLTVPIHETFADH